MSNNKIDNCKDGYNALKSDKGFVAPLLDRGSQCPWRIVLSSGRRANITMYSFLPAPAQDQPLASSSACYEVGTIKEASNTRTIHKCFTDPRLKTLYISNGADVEMTFPNPDTTTIAGAFLIQYKGIYKTLCSNFKIFLWNRNINIVIFSVWLF